MSTYAEAEAGLLAVVRAYASGAAFTAKNSSRGDFRVRDAETTAAAILTQREPSTLSDRGPDGRGSHGRRQHQHRIRVTLTYKRGAGQGGDGVAYEAIQALADDLAAHIERYPLLGGVASVRRAQVAGLGIVRVSEDGAHLLKWLDVDVASEADLDPVETAR